MLAGLFLSLLLPPDPLLFKVILNQAKGTDDKMQLGVGRSGRMPRLGAGPTSHPLHLQLPGSVSPCIPSSEPTKVTPLHRPRGSQTGVDSSDSETA